MSDTYTLIKTGMVIDGTGAEPAQCDVLDSAADALFTWA